MIRALLEKDCLALDHNWEMAHCDPGKADPEFPEKLDWFSAVVPGTVAANLFSNDPGNPPIGQNFDDREYWYRCTFPAEPGPVLLQFQGLATVADIWLNGNHLLATANMFVEHTVETEVAEENTLILRFQSARSFLEEKRPRAKWRTQLVSHRNLRFLRTSLLGRMPGICPSIPPIGPWRPIKQIPLNAPCLTSSRITSKLNARGDGEVRVELAMQNLNRSTVSGEVLVGEMHAPLSVSASDGNATLGADLTIEDPELWWPHTHGTPHRYPITVRLSVDGKSAIELPLPAIGFRTVALTSGFNQFEIAINALPIHCRGAAWMPLDLASLNASPEDIREALIKCRDAGMNMLRVSGTTAYESEAFYELCDELGILVWQDFMFARMDYPTDDPDFRASVSVEAGQTLATIAHRACLAVLCGGTEIRQQAAMLGLADQIADDEWFDTELLEICRQNRPDVLYCPHSPMIGALPFHADAGVAHYFGVGAYRQPLIAAELEPPKFASECLAFSIPPEDQVLHANCGSGSTFDWPEYEHRVPADNGADWSFADVTDHYLSEIFSVDAVELKNSDPSLYLNAARIAVGETMKRTVEAWRRNAFTTGALIWTLKDLEPGAGWGILDHAAHPKAPYYFLKRCWNPVALYFRDRLTNGLWCGLHNDNSTSLEGALTIELGRLDGHIMEQKTLNVAVEPASHQEWSVDDLLGGFVDANYAYRFGPRAFEIAIVSFRNPEHDLTEQRLLMERGLSLPGTEPLPNLHFSEERTPDGFQLEFSADRYIDYLIVDLPGATLSDNYLSILPGKPRKIVVSSLEDDKAHGTARAFNSPVRLDFELASGTRT